MGSKSGHLTPPGPSRDHGVTRRGTATMMGLSKQTNEAFPASSRCQNTPAALKPSLCPSKRSSKRLSSKAVLCCSISDHGHTAKAFTNKVLQQLMALSPIQEPDKNPLIAGVARKGSSGQSQKAKIKMLIFLPISQFFLCPPHAQ